MEALQYAKPRDHSSPQETLILPTPPTKRPTTATNGSTVERATDNLTERNRYNGLARRFVSGKGESSRAYSKDSESRFTVDDFLGQTCPPGEKERYLRHSSGKEHRKNFDQQPDYINYRAMGPKSQSEELLSNSFVESQVQAKKAVPKKPERKKLKKTQEESSKMNHLIQEQMRLEKELKQLQKIREQLVPPLDLRGLNTNHVGGVSDRSITRQTRSPHSKDIKVSPISSGRSISGPAHSSIRPELTSDDSVDREVEGLLSEPLLPGDCEDDTSPLKQDFLNPELKISIPKSNEAQHSSPRLLVNGYHNGLPDRNLRNSHTEAYSSPENGISQSVSHYRDHEPNLANGFVDNYSTTSQNTLQLLSTHRNHSSPSPVVSEGNVEKFCLLKRREMFWMNRIRQQRQILAQPLDKVVRHEVEEQYFYAQEELSRIENAIADLFQHLTPDNVQQLLKAGMLTASPEYFRPSYNLDALRASKHISPSPLNNEFDQRFPSQHPQHAPFPAAPGPAGKGLNVPHRLGYPPTFSQSQYSANVSPYAQNAGNAYPRYQDTSFQKGGFPYQFQGDVNTSSLSFVKPPSDDKGTQTFNEVEIQSEITNSQRLNHNLEIRGSSTSNRDLKEEGKVQEKSGQRVDQINSTTQLQEPDNALRMEAGVSHVYAADSVSLVEEAAPIDDARLKKEDENTTEELVRVETVNKAVYSNTHSRQQSHAVKQPSFDDHEVVKLKEKLEHEQQELRDSLKREQMKFLEEQQRLKEEEERQNKWVADQELQRRMRESQEREVESLQKERLADEVRNSLNVFAFKKPTVRGWRYVTGFTARSKEF